ncbi:MAG: agmatinase [Nitrososphaerales archaeon]
MSYRDLWLSPAPNVSNIIEGQSPKVSIFGVPFDATSTYRSGSRFAPNAIRDAFLNVEVYFRDLDVDLEKVCIEDLGNLKQTSSVQNMVVAVQRVTEELRQMSKVPAIIGGEHTLTYASYSAIRGASLVVFDAHLDLRDEFADLRLSHATYLRRLLEEDDSIDAVVIGARAASKEEWEFAEQRKVKIIPPQDLSLEEYVRKVKSSISQRSVYVSVDLDVVDPAFAPGVGNPEPGGLTSRELLAVLTALRGCSILGFDVVELDPLTDTGSSAALAAKVLALLIALASR